MTTQNHTPNVSSKYGAPMGRDNDRPEDLLPVKRVHLERIRINQQGYDSGGVYWGTGKPLFVAWGWDDTDGESFVRHFLRASTREEAKKLLPEGIKFYR